MQSLNNPLARLNAAILQLDTNRQQEGAFDTKGRGKYWRSCPSWSSSPDTPSAVRAKPC